MLVLIFCSFFVCKNVVYEGGGAKQGELGHFVVVYFVP